MVYADHNHDDDDLQEDGDDGDGGPDGDADGDGDERAVQASFLRCHCQLSAASWSRLPLYASRQVWTRATTRAQQPGP